MPIKKIIFLILIIAVVGMAIYFGWGKFKETVKTLPLLAPETPTSTASLPSTEGLNLISQEKVFDYWFLNDEVFYVTAEGKIIKIPKNGTEEVVQNTTFESLNSLIISPDGQNIAFGFNKPEKFRIFSIIENLWQPLDEKIIKLDWSAATSTATTTPPIAYLKKTANLYNLATYNFKTKKENFVATLASQDVNISWLTPEKILVWEKPSYYKPASLLSFNPKTKKVEVLIYEQPGLMINWSPNKEMALVSKNGPSIEPILYLVNKEIEVITNLPFLTLPSKCAFSEDSQLIACAVPLPQQIRNKWRFPDDWLINKDNFSETLYLGRLTQDGILSQPFLSGVNAEKIKIHQDKLFFINNLDQKLYSTNLP